MHDSSTPAPDSNHARESVKPRRDISLDGFMTSVRFRLVPLFPRPFRSTLNMYVSQNQPMQTTESSSYYFPPSVYHNNKILKNYARDTKTLHSSKQQQQQRRHRPYSDLPPVDTDTMRRVACTQHAVCSASSSWPLHAPRPQTTVTVSSSHDSTTLKMERASYDSAAHSPDPPGKTDDEGGQRRKDTQRRRKSSLQQGSETPFASM